MSHSPSFRTRNTRRLLLSAAFLVGVACGSSTEVPPPASLTKTGGDEQPGSINAPLSTALTVRALTNNGQPASGLTVTWTVTAGGGSVAPAASVTDASGFASTTWTLGPSTGEQLVVASIEGGSTVTFRANASAILDCDATVSLNPGAVCLAAPGRAAQVQVSAGATGAEFVAIPFYDGGFVRSAIAVDAEAQGGIPVSGPPTPSLAPSTGAGIAANGVLTRNIDFERRLRRREREALRPLVSGGRGAMFNRVPDASSAIQPAAPRFAVGDQLQLNTSSTSACTSPVMKTGVVRAESENAIIVEDTENPAGGFTQADYTEILNNFQTIIRPSNVDAFGPHSDIDNNQRIIIFYTIEVNKLTPRGSQSIVGGFFFSRDLFPKTTTVTTPTQKVLGACAGSNAAEMFYMLAPDPQPGTFGDPRTTASVKQSTSGTIAHEYQHLINASRRLYIIPNATFPEAVWLDEGLAHIAEELAYYRATGLAPRQNLTITDILANQSLLNTYQSANLSRYNSYVKKTNTHSPFGETPPSGANPPEDWDDLETRGAIWSFLRWAVDHRGSNDGDAWQRLVRDATTTGADNLRAVFGSDIGARFRQWAAATYMDDAPGMPQIDATFRQPSWNFRSILPAFTANAGQFPLQVFNIGGVTSSFNLVDGGAAYLRFGVAANGSAAVRVTQGGGAQLPPGASVWIVRTK